ncbi:MAG: hypothetical protein FRX48_09743 [Lasallia pustulata]|uniref:Uncharacterized protein n=1 Tax=Lasallia pustulata TaxID=136370 RepID=A0A5M8PCH9_9LECA|nr:MAG: hypothetical protein FRX48_09743 [Lasallia pustulata]
MYGAHEDRPRPVRECILHPKRVCRCLVGAYTLFMSCTTLIYFPSGLRNAHIPGLIPYHSRPPHAHIAHPFPHQLLGYAETNRSDAKEPRAELSDLKGYNPYPSTPSLLNSGT